MNGVAAFRHVVAGGFDAGCDIRSNNIKICNAMFLNKSGKCLAGQGVAPTVYRQSHIRKTKNQRFFITPLYACPKRTHICFRVSVPLIGFLKFTLPRNSRMRPLRFQHIRPATYKIFEFSREKQGVIKTYGGSYFL